MNTITLAEARTLAGFLIVPIISTHAKLSEAVKASGIDLSYNEPLALRDLARHDKDAAHGEAYVVTHRGKAKVFYRYNCPDRLKVLNEYTPFYGCLDNTPFRTVEVIEGHLVFGDACLNRKARHTIADIGWTVSTIN